MTAVRAAASRRALLVAVLAIAAGVVAFLGLRTRADVPRAALARESASSNRAATAPGAADPFEASASERSEAMPSRRIPAGAIEVPAPPEARSPSSSVRCRILGRVLDPLGAPVAGLEVWLLPAEESEEGRYLALFDPPSRETTTDARGEFQLSDVTSGHWLLGPSPRPVAASIPAEAEIIPWAVRVDVPAGCDERRVELRARSGLPIRGRVLQPDGTPAAGAWVSARMPEGRGRCHAAATRDGRFRLGPLPEGQYALWADSDDAGTTSTTVLAFPGEDGAILQLREGGILAGRVLDSRPERRGSVQLTAMREDVEAHEILDTSAGPDGLFRLRNVAPGRYQLVARTDDGWFAVRAGVAIESGSATEDLLLDLGRGGSLRWIPAGSAAASRIEIRKDGVHLERSPAGERGTILVPAGRITVRWTDGSRGVQERSVDVRAGEEIAFPPAD